MEHTIIKGLLEKYWLAETSVEEERTLAAYFKGPDVDPELKPFRQLFAYYEEESGITPGVDFEARILERIHRESPAQYFAKPLLHRMYAGSYAAAAVIILGLALFIMYTPDPSGQHDGNITVLKRSLSDNAESTAGIALQKDTYDDPRLALAAVRRVLLTASARISQGTNITQKNMDRITPVFQTVKKIL